MLKIKMISVGKIKEKSAAELIGEFEKRIRGYAAFEAPVIESAPLPADPTPGDIERALLKEKERFEKEINPRAFKAALCIEGKKYSSEELAELISGASMRFPEMDFLIGGSHGLHADIKNKADILLSMSDMTFPHNIARLMITEQIYRGFTILANTSYHK